MFILSLVGILFAITMVFYSQYSEWGDAFESQHLSDEYLMVNSDYSNEVLDSAKEKLTAFQESNEELDFVEFSDEEFILLINEIVETSLPEGYSIDRYYIDSNDGSWDIYVQLRRGETVLPWLIFTLSKDDIETAELFVADIKVGDRSISDIGLQFVIDDINEGYSEAILTINESYLTKRRWENITLQLKNVIIKGRLNNPNEVE